MGKIEEISESEAVKLNYRKPPWQNDLKESEENFQKILESVNTDKGALVPTYPQGTYRIERVTFGPGKCSIFNSLGSQDISFSGAIIQIGESGFPYQKIQKTYQNP